jgi:hypothetical protein
MEKNLASTSGCLKMPSRSQVLRMAKPWPVWEATSESRNVHVPFLYPDSVLGPWTSNHPLKSPARRTWEFALAPWQRFLVPLEPLEPLRFPATSKGPSRRAHGLWRPHWLWWMRGPAVISPWRQANVYMVPYMSNVFGVINRMIILDNVNKVYSLSETCGHLMDSSAQSQASFLVIIGWLCRNALRTSRTVSASGTHKKTSFQETSSRWVLKTQRL